MSSDEKSFRMIGSDALSFILQVVTKHLSTAGHTVLTGHTFWENPKEELEKELNCLNSNLCKFPKKTIGCAVTSSDFIQYEIRLVLKIIISGQSFIVIDNVTEKFT